MPGETGAHAADTAAQAAFINEKTAIKNRQ
jgi:hypothetical protein